MMSAEQQTKLPTLDIGLGSDGLHDPSTTDTTTAKMSTTKRVLISLLVLGACVQAFQTFTPGDASASKKDGIAQHRGLRMEGEGEGEEHEENLVDHLQIDVQVNQEYVNAYARRKLGLSSPEENRRLSEGEIPVATASRSDVDRTLGSYYQPDSTNNKQIDVQASYMGMSQKGTIANTYGPVERFQRDDGTELITNVFAFVMMSPENAPQFWLECSPGGSRGGLCNVFHSDYYARQQGQVIHPHNEHAPGAGDIGLVLNHSSAASNFIGRSAFSCAFVLLLTFSSILLLR